MIESVLDLVSDFIQFFIDMIINNRMMPIVVYILIAHLIHQAIISTMRQRRRKKEISYIKGLYEDARKYTVGECYDIHLTQQKKDLAIDEEFQFEGMYILYNKTESKYFVGTDKDALDGAMWHITGRGYRDIARSVRQGDEWHVAFIPLYDTESTSIENLWYDGMEVFRSQNKRYGYN